MALQILTTGPGYVGTGYVGFFGEIGQSVKFTVTASAGQATLRFRYRSITPVLRTILVNGVAIATNVTLPQTAVAWSDNAWADYVVTATLLAGVNTIEMRIDSGINQFADLDQLSINNIVSTGLAPTASFTYTPPSPTVGSNVTFVDTSTNTPTSWSWNFGDTTTSGLRNPTHIYNTVGVYQVALTATNASGPSTVVRSVTVTAVGGSGGVTPVNFLTLFKATYPANLSKALFVDGNTGNDANLGTSGSPFRTIQAALNQAIAGTEITVRSATYSSGNNVSCTGTSANWIRVIADPGAKIGRIDGSGAQPGSSGFYFGGGKYVAFYGFEMQGSQDIETGTNSKDANGVYNNGRYDTAFQLINGNNVAVWKCHIHHCGSHGIGHPGNQGNFGSCDAFYNVIHDCANWDPFAGSGISFYQPANVGTAATDGFSYRVIGNVIYNVNEIIGDLTDGNCLIFDSWSAKGYNGKGLAAFNLCVGAGGRAIHELNSSNLEWYFNTTADCLLNGASGLGGSAWNGDITYYIGSNSKIKYNIVCPLNRPRAIHNETADCQFNLFLRGTGGSDGTDPTPTSNNNVDKTGVGPANYLVSYTQSSVVNPVDWRPKDAQTTKVSPDSAVRTLLAPWPDYAGFLRGAGTWAYGAFESPSDAGVGGGTVIAPVANFIVQPTSPIQGTSAAFFDISSNIPTSWLWDFGDGATSTAQNPTHTFAALTSVVYQAESATILGSNYPVDPFSIHSVTDNPGYNGTGYVGYFGQLGQGVRFAITTSSAGAASLQFRYRSLGPQLRTVLVNGVAIATNATLPATATAWTDNLWGLYVIPSVNLNLGANTVEIRINTGTDQYIDLDQLAISSAGSGGSGGTFTVSLTATNASGSSVSQKQVVVQPSGGAVIAPVASFTLAPTSAVVNASVNVLDTSSNTPTSWLWDFGGGGTATTQNATHSWTSAGTKTVTLTATNSAGSNPTTRTIVITVPSGVAPVANFTVSANPTQNSPVTFTDTTTNTPTSWLWNFGDGNNSFLQSPSHTFTAAGTFVVGLTASNNGGSSLMQKNVTIAAAGGAGIPVADFTTSANPTVGISVTFTDTSTNSPTSWTWDFGGG